MNGKKGMATRQNKCINLEAILKSELKSHDYILKGVTQVFLSSYGRRKLNKKPVMPSVNCLIQLQE